MNYKTSHVMPAAAAAAVLLLASAQQGETADFYIGDAAAEGQAVTTAGGPRADTVALLTYVLHGGTAIYTAPSDQRLRLTEVNFFAEQGGTLTPFVARYNGGDTQVGASYEILSLGDPLTAAGGNTVENHAFTVGGTNPVIGVNAGDQIAVGWTQDGNIVYLKEPGPGTPDFISNGDALNGATVGGNLTLPSNWAFDRDMRFNIGVENALLRILPMGDSITDGSAFDSPDGTGGYRGPLYNLLVNAGYEVDYVGTSTVNSELLVEKEHEGHSGWTISQIDSNVTAWLNAIADPDFILLHIGTNDFGGGGSDPAAINRLDNLITKIAGLRPNAHLIVTNLMERGGSANTNIQNDFNPFVQGVVDAQVTAGHLVTFLDMRAEVPIADMPDQLHPNQAGYNKMARAWYEAILAVLDPLDLTPPSIVEVLGNRTGDQVVITFDERLDQSSAETAGNYTLSDGVSVLSATLSPDGRTVTLTTSPQSEGVTYTLTVNGVQDLASPPNTIVTDTTAQFSPLPPVGFFPNPAIPNSEKSGMEMVYEVLVPGGNPAFNTTGVPYTVDNSATTGLGYTRIGYYMEVTSGAQAGDWVYISMDSFDPDPARLGLPNALNNLVARQDIVTNANIYSNNPNITEAIGSATVNLEMWSTNYANGDSPDIPNGTGRFDWSDTGFGTGAGHGSFQIHNHGLQQTLFGWNDWGGNTPGQASEFGIGNATVLGNPNEDWTFSDDGQEGLLQIFVNPPLDVTPPTIVEVTGARTADQIIITFNEALDQASAETVGNYAVSDGVTVLSAALSANLRTVTLTTSPLTLGVTYTLTFNDVQDIAAAPNTIAPDTMAQFSPLPPVGFFPNAAIPKSEKSGMQMVYEVLVPGANPAFNTTGVPYTVDDSASVPLGYTRIGYYVEVTSGAQDGDWVYISMDVFDADPATLGLPNAINNLVARQDIVTNANIYSNNPNITEAIGSATVNLEMWSTNYGNADSPDIPNGTGRFDWSDTGFGTGAGHGSFQIHNHGLQQTLFGWSDWGGNTPGQASEFGIGNATVLGNPNEDWTFSEDGQEGIVQIVVGTPRLQPLRLAITQAGPNLEFEWESQSGMLYNLRSETDPSNGEPATWPIFGGNEDMVATPSTNTLAISLPADPERFFVIEEFPAPPESVFSDDFEGGPGLWTVGSRGAAGTDWELGVPSLVGPPAANSGANCFGTNIAADYQLDANMWLRSVPIDLTTAGGATLHYAEWRDIEEGFDFGSVAVLDATDDSELAVLTATVDGLTADWTEVVMTLPAAALGKTIKLEFRFESDEIGNFSGWYLDDVDLTVP